MNTVSVLIRNPKTGLLEPIESNYEGTISPKVWTYLNNRFLRLEKCGYFFPLEPMDAYNRAAYIRSNGDFRVMAASLHISLSTCYRRYSEAITLARKEI